MNERSLLHPALLTVLLLDQLLKGLAPLLLAPGDRVQLLPGIYYVAVETAVGVAAPERLRLIVIVLLAALVLLRIQQRGGHAEVVEGPALPLLLAGLASNLVDILLLRQHLGLFELGFPNTQVLLSLADVAVASGALLVVVGLSRQATAPTPMPLPWRAPESIEIDLGELRRGIDNVRVDVHLSPKLAAQVRELALEIFVPQIWWEPWRSSEPNPNPRALDALRSLYREVVDRALAQARSERKPAHVALAQLATLKFIRQETTASFERQLRDFRRDLDQDRQRGARTMARLQQHLQTVRRRKPEIIERANELLLEQLRRVETDALQNARQSLLGAAPGLPPAWFENPMLRVEAPDHDGFLMRHYLLLGNRADDDTTPGKLESLLRDWFDCERAELGGGYENAALHSQPTRARQDSCAWLDDPDNAKLLLDDDATAAAMAQARRRRDGKALRELRQRSAQQRGSLKRIERGLRAAGLLDVVLAAYELATIWRSLSLPVNPRVVLRYLADPTQRRRLAPRLYRFDRGDGGVREQLEAAVRRLEQMGMRERERQLYRFVHDFLRYRRDLKRLRLVRDWCDQIKLLTSKEELRLARINCTGYELFSAADDEATPETAVAGHVIVKADLRGSTTMTAQLAERGLNPATHFSINFFEPIRGLIKMYGAEKVFVEGDAVILAILEREGESSSRLCVSRACGLARSIIEVVSAHNSTVTQFGLPSLELGIGVAYEQGAPTWLFDEEKPIMISPAIGRADRLSSCAAFLRKAAAKLDSHPLQVFQAVGRTPVYDKEGVTTFRYNVDGIELEAGAFQKLEREMHLHLLELQGTDRGAGTERFYRGRYPDARGVMRNLVVREGRIRRFDRREGPLGETSQSFYEVIVDTEIVGRVMEAGTTSRSDDDSSQ